MLKTQLFSRTELWTTKNKQLIHLHWLVKKSQRYGKWEAKLLTTIVNFMCPRSCFSDTSLTPWEWSWIWQRFQISRTGQNILQFRSCNAFWGLIVDCLTSTGGLFGGFSSIVVMLTVFLEKKMPKKLLSSSELLCWNMPDPTKQLIVAVNALETREGSVLSQRFGAKPKLHPVAFFSRTLSLA